jgi:acyl-CoA thioesterase
MDAAALARACAEVMWAEDVASRSLGMRLISVEPGRAVLGMTVSDTMVNGHGLCHGGFIFMLADSAFATACNSYNRRAVGQHCAISYLSPARSGDRLVARAIERSRAGRSGLYDVTVTGEEGPVIAEFRGHSRMIVGEIIPGLGPTGVSGL